MRRAVELRYRDEAKKGKQGEICNLVVGRGETLRSLGLWLMENSAPPRKLSESRPPRPVRVPTVIGHYPSIAVPTGLDASLLRRHNRSSLSVFCLRLLLPLTFCRAHLWTYPLN